VTVALAMIVRDEEADLPACLDSVRGFFDEIVIVDTGSTDHTIRLARKFGARVYRFPWCDDFSVARNYGLECVLSDYVFRMDADDRLPKGQRKRMERLLTTLGDGPPKACAFRVHSKEESGLESTGDEWRLWPHGPGRRFRGRIHERIPVEEFGCRLEMTTVHLEHVGYASEADIQRKLERNCRISELEIAAGPVDPFTLFDYARTLKALNRRAEAKDALLGFLKVRDKRYDMAGRLTYRLLVDLYDDPREALAMVREGLEYYPRDSALYLCSADLLSIQGLHAEAAEGYRLALQHHDPTKMETGLRSDYRRLVEQSLEQSLLQIEGPGGPTQLWLTPPSTVPTLAPSATMS
jgi:glycosyltransferase involved in cell wall biosynthesis